MTTIRNILFKGTDLEEVLALTEPDRKTYENFSEIDQ